MHNDASKCDTCVKFNVVFPSFSRGASVSGTASVFTAELSAVVLAHQIVFTLPIAPFTIFSEFRSVPAALNSFTSSSLPHLLLFALEWLYLLNCKGYNICFCWLPGHVGARGNKQADRLAR